MRQTYLQLLAVSFNRKQKIQLTFSDLSVNTQVTCQNEAALLLFYLSYRCIAKFVVTFGFQATGWPTIIPRFRFKYTAIHQLNAQGYRHNSSIHPISNILPLGFREQWSRDRRDSTLFDFLFLNILHWKHKPDQRIRLQSIGWCMNWTILHSDSMVTQ